jgi:hypothetical protein
MSLYKDDATSENFLLISIFLWALSLCFNSKYGFKVGGVFCNSDAETLLFLLPVECADSFFLPEECVDFFCMVKNKTPERKGGSIPEAPLPFESV